jgi:DNA-binding LacI/PurR family transcriptional regulator
LQVSTTADADTLDGGRRAARAALDRSAGVTALVCVNDVMAVGALRELRGRGLRVPEDVSVTGFDNVTLAQFAVPALTTMHVPRDEIGRTICQCLLSDGSPPTREFIIEPELVVRDSTGPAR